jgi:hypothetical protein
LLLKMDLKTEWTGSRLRSGFTRSHQALELHL